MIYDSATGRTVDTDGFPLTTKDGEFIHIGGDADPEQAGIPDLDIERVVELYTAESAESHSTPEKSDPKPEGSQSTPEQPQWKAVTKRWWSVKEDYLAEDNDLQAWPDSGDGSRTIPYCFQHQRAWDNLGPLLTQALTKWAVVIRVSSLNFAPDTACRQVPCLCTTPNVADTSLRIIQARPDQQIPLAMTTTGYKNPNIPVHGHMPRHCLIWPANTNFYGTAAQGTLMMAHELGEYTRPKASKEGERC